MMRSRRSACLLLALAPAAAFAAPGPLDPVACPAGQEAQMTRGDFDAQLAPYQGGELDPLPRGQVERPLPVVNFVRADLEDASFPPRGRASAVLLVRENGTVARVLVPCTSSYKLVEPIVDSLKKAQLDPATRKGVAVRSIVVVPVKFGD